MSTTAPGWTDLNRLHGDADELLAEHTGGDVRDLSAYLTSGPAAFGLEVLRSEYWDRQEDILETAWRHPRLAVRSANAMGKNFAAADLMAWWVYVKGGRVLYIGNVDRQLDIGMRELGRALRGSGLPFERYHRRLRVSGVDRVFAFTSSSSDGLRGFHDPVGLLVLIDEGQGQAVEAVAYDAAFSCATGPEDRIVVLGNPSNVGGRFQAICESASWVSLKISAFEHPNIVQGCTVIPGGPAPDWPQTIAREYGRDSAFYRAFVEAEFPSESEDALIERVHVDAAVERFKSGQLEEEARHLPFVLGCDPAGPGKDSTVICIRQGPIVRRFIQWRKLEAPETTERIISIVRELLGSDAPLVDGAHVSTPGVRTVYVDEVGLGFGISGELNLRLPSLRYWNRFDSSDGYPRGLSRASVEGKGVNVAKSPGDKGRFVRRKCELLWHLRTELVAGRLALPPSQDLIEELLAARMQTTSDGRLLAQEKRMLRARLGRSPDFLDAFMISLSSEVADGKRRVMWA